MTTPGDSELPHLVGDVVNASKIPGRQRGTIIKPTVDKLCSVAYEHGLLPEPLNELLELVSRPNYLDQASLGAIVRHLYPASAVSGDAVIKLVGCLGHGELKPSLAIQAALLRWLVMVYHVIDAPKVLSRAYTVLFNLLDTAAIRAQICHVLALITRRKHVQPFRIQAVLNLSRQTGSDPALIGLLRVYKDYYPEIIVGDAVRGKASAFKHPDLQWRLRLDEIQETRLRQTQNGTGAGRQHGFQVRRQLGRPRKSVIPVVHTSHATEESVTLEEIDNVNGFVENLESIQLPNQLVAVLADPLLQKLLLLRPEEESYLRINNWILATLQDIRSGEADATTIGEVLGLLYDYVVVAKEMPPLILNFFVGFLKHWNGKDGRDEVLKLLAYAPLVEFEKLYENIFAPLESQIDNTTDGQLSILKLYTQLLRHWYTLLLATDKMPEFASPGIAALVEHVRKLSVTLTQTWPTMVTYFAILDFYEQYAALVSDEHIRQYIKIVIPPRTTLIYTLFFSPCLAVVSRLCAVLCCYKKGIEMAMSIKPPRKQVPQMPNNRTVHAETYHLSETSRFNGFIMDICNCLLRMHAFSIDEPNAAGCLVPRTRYRAFKNYVESLDTNITLPALFGVSHSPALSLHSILAVRELEDDAIKDGGSALATRHAGPVTQASLARLRDAGGLSLSWGEYRVAVLHRLEAQGFAGISELAKNTMKTLMKPKPGSAAGRA